MNFIWCHFMEFLFKGKSYVFFSKKGLSYRVFLNNNFSKFQSWIGFFSTIVEQNQKTWKFRIYIYLSSTINEPIFSEVGAVKTSSKNPSKKKTCEIFLQKKIDFFFIFLPKGVVFTLLKGPKTMRKRYWVVFEKFEKSL